MTLDLLSRRGILGVFAATTVAAAPVMGNAFGLLRGAGDMRRIRMYSGRTGESLDTVYWVDGKYIREALNEINIFMRDWRTGEAIGIDPRSGGVAEGELRQGQADKAASHRLLQTNEPYMMLSGYRSPRTNAMLRRSSGGVARNSLHMVGKAADLRLKSRSVGQMYNAAASCRAGGVGKYSRSNFVHMDCGPVRNWGA